MKKRSLSASQLRDIPSTWTRDQKIQAMLPVAQRLSRRFPIQRNRVSLDYDDLYAVSCHAVVEAVDRFDASKGITLPQFVVNKVNWALMDLFRKTDHASRAMQERGEHVHWINIAHTAPNDADVLDEVYLDAIVDSDVDVQGTVMASLERELIREYISRLPTERERDIMRLNVYEGRTNLQIAHLHKISPTRVNQLIARSVQRMQDMYREESQTVPITA